VYVERRDFSLGEVLEHTAPFAQPQLLETKTESVASTSFQAAVQPDTGTGRAVPDAAGVVWPVIFYEQLDVQVLDERRQRR